jgi:hypothetical protein
MMVACKIYGQDHERKILVYANGAYSQHKANHVMGLAGYNTELKGGKISVGMYRKVNSFLYAGIELGYEERNEFRHNTIDNFTNPSDNSAYFNNHSKHEESKIIPTVNFKFFKNPIDRLSFGLNVLTGYGFTKKMDESIAAIVIGNQPQNPFFLNSYYNSSNEQGIYFRLQPEIVYFVYSWLGVSAEFNLYTYDAVNASQFFIATNSNDIMWSFGVVFPIK